MRKAPDDSRFAGRGSERAFRQLIERTDIKAGCKAFQSQRRYRPVAVAARTRKQVDLARYAFQKRRAQLGVKPRIITGGSRQSYVESASIVSHQQLVAHEGLIRGFPGRGLWYPFPIMGETRIIAFGGGSEGEQPRDESVSGEALVLDSEQEAAEAPWYEEDVEVVAPMPDRVAMIARIVAILLAVAWTGWFIWAHLAPIGTAPSPTQATELVGQWCVPVLLIAVLWLLAMRSSSREATRFGGAARILSDESARLEDRLKSVNGELSLARDFLTSQSRDLETLGRLASERLSANAQRLEDLIRDNGSRLDSIGAVSSAALENMEKLRGQLPVIASSTKDVTNTIAGAGRTAQDQLDGLIGGLGRLEEAGTASERKIAGLGERIDRTMASLSDHCEAIGDSAAARFNDLDARGEEMRLALDKHEVEALAAVRSRAEALKDEIEASRRQIDGSEADSLASLRTRLAALREEGSGVSRTIISQQDRMLERWKEAIGAIEAERERIDELIHTASTTFTGDFADRLSHLEKGLHGLDNDLDERRRAFDASRRDTLEGLRDILTRLDTELAERQRILAETLEDRRAKLEREHADSLAWLEKTRAEFDANFGQVRDAQAEQTEELGRKAEAVTQSMGRAVSRLREVVGHASDAEDVLSRSLDAIAERTTASRATLAATDTEIERLTDSSMRLLELIQASATSASKDLPEAVSISEGRLARVVEAVERLEQAVSRIGEGHARVAKEIDTTNGRIEAIVANLDTSHETLVARAGEHGDVIRSLDDRIANLDARTRETAAAARVELADAISQLESAVKEVVESLESGAAQKVAALSVTLGETTSNALERAVRQSTAEATGQLEQAAAHASGVGREAAIQLRDQLAKVNDLVGNLENRVAHARQRAEEQVDNDFARRVALLTESLNSYAIDIAKALSTDVSDTAWAAYLRGDRGIFTRRAVALLDASEVRRVQQTFENDDEFRGHVNRYIHDFEAILRQVLSTRDGNALGVTLLSSDMGKLYVALAQGIERLRN